VWIYLAIKAQTLPDARIRYVQGVDLFGNSPPSNPSSYPMHSILWGVVGGQRPRANRASSQSITYFSQPPKYHKCNFETDSPRRTMGRAESTKNAGIPLRE
jgi:hypothetical protein